MTHDFNAAVDAIINGDSAALSRLLRANPELVRFRSTGPHRSTLLHYVSANGVEDVLQKTPKNIVEIANLLLDAGADVNAESDAYGGHSTALNLTATSCHPENAGVQIELMTLLLERGARIGDSDVNACLHNGRGAAAEFLAARGGSLDLEGAAGVGRLDLVERWFDADGRLRSPATRDQMADGFAWACEYGRTSVVAYLLDRGIRADEKLRQHGQTGLHWAAYGGHANIVKLLLERGAPVDTRDDTYHGTPLGWALHRWSTLAESARSERCYETVALLVRAGAKPDPPRNDAAIRSDSRMAAALRGEMPE
jgi:ankyrin repeat protein